MHASATDQLGRPAEPSVAAYIPVTLKLLREKLGRTAYDVWIRALAMRSPRGAFHATRRGIARAKGFAPMTEVRVKKGLERLAMAGLVEPIGWIELDVIQGHKVVRRKVFVRKAYGAKTMTQYGVRATVPPKTKMFLEVACGHGGRRDGAGRPCAKTPPPGWKSSGPTPPRFPKSSGAIDKGKVVKGKAWLKTSSSTARPRDTRPAHADTKSEGKEPIVTTPSSGAGARLPGPIVSGGGIPPYPDSTVVRAATVPEPPKLNPHDALDDQVAAMLRAYRSTAQVYTGKRCGVLRRGNPRNTRYWKTLVSCASLLIEHGIAPLSWVRFSFDVWGHMGHSSRPNLSWVFSPARLERQQPKSSKYHGGRAVITKSHRELLKRYERMRIALHGLDHVNEASVQAVVNKYFPRGTWTRLVALAKQEATEEQHAMKARLLRGEWPV